jgi:hypothetical protein
MDAGRVLGGCEFPFHRLVRRIKHARVLDGTGRSDRPIGGLVSALTPPECQLARNAERGRKLQQLRPGRDVYSLTSLVGAIPAEIFESRHYGTVMLAAILGVAGVL